MTTTSTRKTPATRKRTTKAAETTPAEATPEAPAAEATLSAEEAEALKAQIAELEAELEARNEKPTNVIEAILAVMRDVRAVGKDGQNLEQGFNFRGIDGTVNALGPAMRKHGLVVLPRLSRKEHEQVTTRNNRTMNSVHVEVEYHFYGPGGIHDTVVAITPGESFDSGDKGTAKAMSVAFRTALLQGFALPTQERDPDEDSYELATPPTTKEFQDEVESAVDGAGDDAEATVAALVAIGEKHGRDLLDRVAVPGNENRRAMTGSQFLEQAIGYYSGIVARRAEERAEQERAAAETDLASQPGAAPASAPSAQQDGAPGAAQPGAPVQGDAPAQSAPQTAPATSDAPAPDAPTEHPAQRAAADQTRADVAAANAPKDAFMGALMSEISGHAAILGVEPRAYTHDLVSMKPGATSVTQLPVGVVRQWVIDRRPSIVGALRQQGRASLAAALEHLGAQVQPWERITAMAEQDAGAEAPAHV